jgi:hypothetical protein
VLWKRLRLFSLFLAAILAFFAFEGVKTLRDVRSKIEPIVSSAGQKAQDTKRTVDGFAGRVNSVKASLDALTHEVDVQEKRVTASGVAGLSIKISKLQDDTQRLQNTVGTLGSSVGTLSGKVQQVSTQVDNASVRQAYPTVGQQLFVTYRGAPWKNPTEKRPGEKWANIVIYPYALPEVSQTQLEKLLSELKKANFTPILGEFGVGGPYYSGFGGLGDSNQTTVFYFKKDAEAMANEASAIASTILSDNIRPKFVDPQSFSKDDLRGYVIDHSGLDLQLVVIPRIKPK